MNMKKILQAACLLLCLSVGLCACGGQEAPAGTTGSGADASYQVSIVDAGGNAYTEGVIVRFLQNGQQVAMQPINAQGVAEKTLPKGDYTVELIFTDSKATYYYDDSDLTMTAEKTALQITLSNGTIGEAQVLYAQEKEYNAYSVAVGDTHVSLTTADRNYFLFAPTEAGLYEFSCAEKGTVIGYYGAPHFVQEHTAADVKDNAFTVSVRADMISSGQTGTTVVVIGLDSETAEEAILSIHRIGDPVYTIEDEPWTVYAPTAELKPYTLPAGVVLKDFDLTAEPYTLVLNEADGFYHLNTADGPLVLVRLGEKSGGSKYLDCFEKIIGKSGVVKYFFDAEGNFVKKESYTECLMKYIGYVDQSNFEAHAGCMDPESGLYPLTEDLKYIIQQRGEYAGWWDAESGMYLFSELSGLNTENAWLFMCCYIGG